MAIYPVNFSSSHQSLIRDTVTEAAFKRELKSKVN